MSKLNKVDEKRLWRELRDLSDFGQRAPGSQNHKKSHDYLMQKLKPHVDDSWYQNFSVNFRGNKIECANLCGIKKSRKAQSTILMGSHFDTRWIADNEADPGLQNKPIPGVNDGGSGVAIIIELARVLGYSDLNHNLVYVLFDAEDLGNIDGLEFSIGAREYAVNGKTKPDLVIILDMVGGRNMHINIENNSLGFKKSYDCFRMLFQIGRQKNFPAFFNNQQRYIISDHYPFLLQNIPSIILIDIDYPQWHTQLDDIDHCSSFSLYQVAEVLHHYLISLK